MANAKILLFTHKTLIDGTHPVVIQVIHNRQRRLFSLGYSAKESQWNSDKNIPNHKHPKKDKLRGVISSKMKLVTDRIFDLDRLGEPYHVDDVLEILTEQKKPASFATYTDYLVAEMKKEGRNGNARAYQDAKRAFTKFLDKDDIDFKNITVKLLNRFESHLLSKGRKPNGIAVYLRTLRAIYNKAIMDGLVSEKYYPFSSFKIKHEKTIKRAIPKEMLKKIRDKEYTGQPRKDLARDIFMFSFYTRGMNFIDIFYLQNKNINGDRINYRRKKTGQVFSVKLTAPAKEIIKKYSNDDKPDNYVFPVINSNSEYTSYRTAIRNLNKSLKEIGESFGLSISLSSYVARHTWATIAKFSGLSTSVISEGLGHDSEKTTQIYLDSFGDDVLDNANDKIINDL